ncbi:MAG TPA: Do family serine endopeptidase [Micropepsaceae bacterium]|nr:Do family serine endopeptidase [Micropepsaceae bacterium]
MANTTSVAPDNGRNAAMPTLAPMIKRAEPGVVNISVDGTVEVNDAGGGAAGGSSSSGNPLYKDPFFRRFFNLPTNPKPQTEHVHAVGSGVVYDAARGYILTNYHVISDANKIRVTLSDGRELPATLVAGDEKTDVAVLKVASNNLTQLPIGQSKRLAVGDYVVAIGDPFGVGQAATFGIVSALGRNNLGIEGYEDFIQTDASINPGNSGGALLDMNGKLIGINTAILTHSNGNVGVGFAIPIDMADAVAKQLIAHGSVSRGELGVVLQDLTPSLATAMSVNGVIGGAVISDVKSGTAADAAGLKVGDVVIGLDGQPISTSGQLRMEIGTKPPGTKIAMNIMRNGQKLTIDATLRQPEGQVKTAALPATKPAVPEAPMQRMMGLTLSPIPQDNKNYGKVAGLYVANVDNGSDADQAGVQAGDIITSVDNKPVTSPQQLSQVVQAENPNKPSLLQVRRGDSSVYVALG